MTHDDRPPAPDAAAILQSVGEAAYEWQLDTDKLSWSANAAAVLGIADIKRIATGRAYAARTEAEKGGSRAEVIAAGSLVAGAAGAPYETQYAFARDGGERTWIEDTGRWFPGADGKPVRAHGVVRAIDARHEQETTLARLAKFDPVSGALNRTYLTQMLAKALEEALRFRGSCGFLLLAIDHLGELNEAYGFEVTEEVIAKIARRIRARLRGDDLLGRFAGNKFGVVLTRCAGDELTVAAERLLAGVRDETIMTNAGPVAATVTIGGVNIPRHARSVAEILSRAQDALSAARARRHG